MTDIAKCSGTGCNIRNSCYRFTSDEEHGQNWIKGNLSDDGEVCQDFWADTEDAARDMKKKIKERKAS